MTDSTETVLEQDAAKEPAVNAASIDDFTTIGTANGDANVGDQMSGEERNLDTILGIPVNIQVVLGSANMLVANLLKLGRGSVIPLNHRVGEPVDIVVNGRVVARGEVVVVEDDNSRFGVSLTEIIGTQNGPIEA